LWDDPLFTSQSSIDDWELKDPEFVDLRRRLRLKALHSLYIKIDRLEAEIARRDEWRQEADAREIWAVRQLLSHVPAEIGERLLVDLQVNDMDPDFSFCKAIEAK
jgi:hypothetical protein